MRAFVALPIALVACSSSRAPESVADVADIDDAADSSVFESSTPPTPTIWVTPSSAAMTVRLDKPMPSQAFSVKLFGSDGLVSDVTTSALFSVDDSSLGSFEANVFRAKPPPSTEVVFKTSSFSVKHAVATTTGNISLLYLRPPRTDAVFLKPECTKVRPYEPGADVIAFTAKTPEHSVRVVAGDDSSLVVRVEPYVAEGCTAAPTADRDGDGVADGYAGALIGATLCYRVIADNEQVVKRQGAQVKFVTVALDAGETRYAVFIIPPRYSGPAC